MYFIHYNIFMCILIMYVWGDAGSLYFGLLIKFQSLIEVRSLLFSMFVIFSNETNGMNFENGQEIACKFHKK